LVLRESKSRKENSNEQPEKPVHMQMAMSRNAGQMIVSSSKRRENKKEQHKRGG
jgi:hypothetical protein